MYIGGAQGRVDNRYLGTLNLKKIYVFLVKRKKQDSGEELPINRGNIMECIRQCFFLNNL